MPYQLERSSYTSELVTSKEFSSDERLAIKISSLKFLKHLYLVITCFDLDILLLIFLVKHTVKWSLIEQGDAKLSIILSGLDV